jgi:hypothetical protein
LRSTWVKHQSLAKAKSGFYGALPRNFTEMKSLPGLDGKDLPCQSQCSMKDVGIVIHNQGHEFACNVNPSFVSPAGTGLSRLAKKHLRMDALFNHWPALMRAQEHWKRAFSRQNLKVRQG